MSDGLEGVVAAETVLSHSDGERGIARRRAWFRRVSGARTYRVAALAARFARQRGVWVRGRPIEDLVAHEGYEGTVALLWDGFAGDGLTRADVAAQLGAGRVLAFSRLEDWLPATTHRPPIEAMRMSLAALPDDSTPAEIAASLSVAVAALVRYLYSSVPVPPDPSLDTAADLLRMCNDAPVEPRFVAALDSYLTTVIDNGLGSSTFAARVVISTRASLASAVLGAYCAFSGPLHGGAPGLALDMLDEIAESDHIDEWLDHALDAGRRLMGFGHRVFRARDPRADLLRAALRRFDPGSRRLAFAQEVERHVVAALQRRKPGRRLEANVEMDAALLLDAIGFPRETFTPVFAVARAPAWIAHALEQQRSGRMIRPTSSYVGPAPSA